MDQDEDLARKLQAQFDAEVRAAEVQENRDAAMAQNLASQSHLMSDSEGEEEEELAEAAESRGNGVKLGGDLTGAERRKVPRARSSDDQQKFTPSADTVRLEHTVSDEEDQEAGGRVSEPQAKHTSGLQGNSTGKTQEKKPDGESGGSKTGATKLPLCKFGSSCYRKNPWHLQEFYHPHLDEEKATTNASGSLRKSSSEPPKKRSRESITKKTTSQVLSAKQPFPVRLLASRPFNFFLNKTYSVKETQDDPLTLVLPDILSQHMGDLVESAQLNFMVDLEFLMSNYKAVGQAGKPLLVMYGQLDGNPRDYPGLTCTKVNIPFQYGTHHTKMMLLQYKVGLRVVVHTANLVPDDWYEKTQGYWVSSLFPELENGKCSILDGESPTRFKRDLVEYLQSYKAPDLTRWSHLAKRYDFTTCNVFLVGSSPGYHAGEHKERWGHMKVRRVLHQHAATWQSSRPVITQCSSIGSLGKDDRTWLSGELGLSLTGAQGTCVSPPNVRVIYPSEDDVFNSSQGWMGGSCLPYNSNTHEKQSWLIRHLHVWRSEQRRRTRAMPHIKTYTRASKNHTEVQFLLLTSANLSKAAWGALQKQNSQLFIRSYEVGVLLLPKFVTDSTEFKVGAPGTSGSLALPYDLPLTPYPDGAKPWFMNTTKKRKDAFGQTYLE